MLHFIPKVGDCGSILLVLLHVLLDGDNGDDGVLLQLVQSVGPGLPASTFKPYISFVLNVIHYSFQKHC